MDGLNPQRILILANRHSRRGGEQADAIEARLRAGGRRTTLVLLDRRRPIDAVIRERGSEADLVAVGGGDGTMNAAAAAMVELGKPMAVLPMGTANDLARTLGLPADPVEAAALILEGHTRRIDLGKVNDRLFFNVASIGLSVRVAKALTREVKQRYGVLSYPITVYRALREGKSFRAEIRHEGGFQKLRSIQLAVGNGRYYGGGMVVHEEAAIDDRTLHLYCLKPQPIWKLAMRSLAIRQGRHYDPEVALSLAGPGFEVVTKRPMSVNTDGEVTTYTPARFSVVPEALEVVVPAPA